MKTPDMKPCPICGSHKIWLWKKVYCRWRKYSFECFSCGLCGEWANTERGAIRKWNRGAKEVNNENA